MAKSYLPLIHGYGTQIGLSDPVFMSRLGKQPIVGPDNQPVYPYESEKLDVMSTTDPKAKEIATFGREWLKELSGMSWNWEDLRFIRENWDGPLVVKGIQCPEVGLHLLPSVIKCNFE